WGTIPKVYGFAPLILDFCELSLSFLFRWCPRIIRCPFTSGLTPVQYQTSGPIWIGSRKKDAHVATLGGTKQHSTFRAHGIHNRVHVFHALFQRGISNFPV